MKHPAGRLLGLLGVAALVSQAGHLLVYQIQFGAAAAAVQSQGSHTYFSALAKTSLGFTAALLLACLVIVGVARLGLGRPVRRTSSPPFMPLVSILFTTQIVVFVAQETIEALVAGAQPPHVMVLLLLGTLGQLPVATVAALAVKWLSARLEFAILWLRHELGRRVTIAFSDALPQPRRQLVLAAALAETSPASFVKRGPPLHLLH